MDRWKAKCHSLRISLKRLGKWEGEAPAEPPVCYRIPKTAVWSAADVNLNPPKRFDWSTSAAPRTVSGARSHTGGSRGAMRRHRLPHVGDIARAGRHICAGEINVRATAAAPR
ncbi:MAG: hypothetical protein NT069_25485 [Planctomycetota bacterium]|nr:hypothetical protein [Planctomycetota bacterium]